MIGCAWHVIYATLHYAIGSVINLYTLRFFLDEIVLMHVCVIDWLTNKTMKDVLQHMSAKHKQDLFRVQTFTHTIIIVAEKLYRLHTFSDI